MPSRQTTKNRRKERLNHLHFILHEHNHTFTSEDDVLELLGLPNDTKHLDSFRQESEHLSHKVTLWENVVARITFDDKTVTA